MKGRDVTCAEQAGTGWDEENVDTEEEKYSIQYLYRVLFSLIQFYYIDLNSEE